MHYEFEVYPRGGHSIVKLKTTCEQSLLPLYYIPQIISNFMIFFSIYTYPLIISFFIFLDFLVIFIFLVIFFGSILRHSSQKRYVFQKKIFIKFGYQFLLCNRYHVYVLKKIDRIMTRFVDATQKKQIFFVRTWFSTRQCSDLPVGVPHARLIQQNHELI